MDIYFITKIACLYVIVASSEMLNGIARTVYLNKRMGVTNAKRMSMLSALSLCLLICYSYVPTMRISSDKELQLVGVSLSLFMLMFDMVLGRYVIKAKWSTIYMTSTFLRGIYWL